MAMSRSSTIQDSDVRETGSRRSCRLDPSSCQHVSVNEIAVVIPYGNGTPWRKQALHHVMTWYAENLENARILLGHSRDPWCKARAVAEALKRSNGESIVIIGDADSISPGVQEAVQAVRNGAAWAMPHLKVYRFNQDATRKVYEGSALGALTGRKIWYDQDPYKGYEGGGITVLKRDAYLDCPLDPAFIGWGQEDEAWAMALNGLYGPPWRGEGPLYHLWHEKPERKSRYVGSDASLARLNAYKEARIQGNWGPLLWNSRTLALGEPLPCTVAI